MISKTNQYAIRAVLHVAQHQHAGPLRAAQIARALQLPANYLAKILHSLARAGVLHSERGPRGGFQLARPAKELWLSDVIAPFDPVAKQRECLMGREECSDESPCSLHESWRHASDPMIDFFRQTALADLLDPADGQ